MKRFAAIDQGTTSTRGYVLDESGTGGIVCSRKHRQIYPQTGWVEHDPEELLGNVLKCIEAAGVVDAIGIANQGESCLAWHAETGEAISPVLVWQDRRTESTIARLKSDGAEELTLAKAGLPLDPYFSASKLAWILQNIPEARILLAQGKLRLGTTDAFFIDRLTGNYTTDITTASRTSLVNLETGQWDSELCDLFGIPLEILPEIKPTMSDFGTVHVRERHIRLTACVVDQQASLFGHGCRNTGDEKITFGTGAFALATTGSAIVRAPEKGLLPTVAWQQSGKPAVFALDGGVYSAASALNWARSLGLFNNFAEINAFDAPPAISRNLAFVPALTGLGCPHWDGSAAGMWIGLSLDTTAINMVQSILEGVAFRAAEVIDAMQQLTPVGQTISIDGGLSNNPWFCQFLADVLQKTITVQSGGELTAFGTAMMAAGHFNFNQMQNTQRISYDPQAIHIDGKALFSKAVSRCRNW
ncbi:FGGY family carbohydrate kinase [Profundibacter sp.]|uniref:FGGY family carbohydrate kinase n=1 Tax=Profundibacter sp. TaxID=3101071 RepID=UPI003D0A0406